MLLLDATHLDEVEDHSFRVIYYDKPYLRAHSFGMKDYLVEKVIDDILGPN